MSQLRVAEDFPNEAVQRPRATTNVPANAMTPHLGLGQPNDVQRRIEHLCCFVLFLRSACQHSATGRKRICKHPDDYGGASAQKINGLCDRLGASLAERNPASRVLMNIVGAKHMIDKNTF
jgi:hypothetical protein